MPNEMTTAEKLRHWALWCDCTNNGCEIKWLLLEAAAEIEKKENLCFNTVNMQVGTERRG